MLYQSISSVNLLQASISVIYFFNSANQTHDFHQGDSFSTSFEGLKPFAQVFVYVEFSDTFYFYCCFLLVFAIKTYFSCLPLGGIDGVIMLLEFDKVYKSTATV